ncbi:MAG TPA: beta-ketoacyl synthase N-terminal-like domain-containing protein, partial [Acidimicrobiales bacterium]|nr:beta-ketoacyl synthase N-terminal-like domain-containing protein [Acidimicrobiales bacterium]
MLLGLGPDGPVAGRRVAITGIGAVSCCGVGADALWNGLNGPPPTGERRVADFDPSPWLGPKEARQLDRFAQFSVAVALMAMEDAGSPRTDPGRSGVVMGTGVGGLESLESQILLFGERGPRRVSPRLV